MVRGFPACFSRLLFPCFGMGEVRFEPEFKGEVGWGPDFGGMKSLGHVLPGEPPERFPPPAHRKGRSEGLEMGNASLLETSRGSWKQGGAISKEGYKGTQSAESVSRVEVLVVFVLVVVLVLVGRCACVEVGVCGEAVRGATRLLELAVGGGPGVAKEARAGGAACCVARTCAFV